MRTRNALFWVGLGITLLGVLGCNPEGAPAAAEGTGETAVRLPCIEVEPVGTRLVRDELMVRANLLADRTSIVMSRSTGYVAEIQVNEGDWVEGDETVLLSIRAEELDIGVSAARAGVEAAEAGVNQARLQLRMAELDLDRIRSLHDRGATTQEQVDRATTMVEQLREGVRQAEAQVSMARSSVRQAREMAGDTEVLAPFDGVVLHRLVEIGGLVSAFPPTPLFQVIDPRQIRVTAHVPERDAERVRQGLPIRIELGDGRTLSAQLDYVAPGLDPLSRTLEVRSVLDNADGALRHGQSAWIRIELGEHERPFLPRHVFKRVEGNRGYLFGLNADRESVRELEVRLGPVQDSGYPVLEGLEAGTPIVTRGWTPLSEGALVEIAVDGSCAREEH